MTDLDGYLTHRVLTMDEAEATGDLLAWQEIGIDLEPWQQRALQMLAKAKGVSLEDLLAAIVEQRTTQVLRGPA